MSIRELSFKQTLLAIAKRINLIDDYVVEQGDIDIWTYRKWNSGIAECWGKTPEETIVFSQASGSGYYVSKTVNFPEKFFLDAPVALSDRCGTSGLALITTGSQAITPTYINTFIWSTISTTQACQIAYTVKGLWKKTLSFVPVSYDIGESTDTNYVENPENAYDTAEGYEDTYTKIHTKASSKPSSSKEITISSGKSAFYNYDLSTIPSSYYIDQIEVEYIGRYSPSSSGSYFKNKTFGGSIGIFNGSKVIRSKSLYNYKKQSSLIASDLQLPVSDIEQLRIRAYSNARGVLRKSSSTTVQTVQTTVGIYDIRLNITFVAPGTNAEQSTTEETT